MCIFVYIHTYIYIFYIFIFLDIDIDMDINKDIDLQGLGERKNSSPVSSFDFQAPGASGSQVSASERLAVLCS